MYTKHRANDTIVMLSNPIISQSAIHSDIGIPFSHGITAQNRISDTCKPVVVSSVTEFNMPDGSKEYQVVCNYAYDVELPTSERKFHKLDKTMVFNNMRDAVTYCYRLSRMAYRLALDTGMKYDLRGAIYV